jgi:hypothetical protein
MPHQLDVFVDALDLAEMGFDGADPAATGRPAYHPSVLLKLYIYGYLNREQSSRRLEREAGRNVELMWLRSRLAPDHKTIADFRKSVRLLRIIRPGDPRDSSRDGSWCNGFYACRRSFTRPRGHAQSRSRGRATPDFREDRLLKSRPELQICIMQLTRERSPPPGLRLPQTKLSRNSNQVARGRIRRFESDMPSQAVSLHRHLQASLGNPLGY